MQPSHPFSSPSPLAFNLSLHQGLFHWASLCLRWPKYWSFSISPSNEYSGLISSSFDCIDFLAIQGTLESLPQHHRSNHQFFSAQLSLWSNSPMHTWWLLGKLSFDIWTFVGKVMSLPFNTLSRWVIAFLPRSKRLSLSWLQSPSAVVLKPQK